MPKRKRESDESDYEDDGGDQDDSSEDADLGNNADDDEEFKLENKKPSRRKTSSAVKKAWSDLGGRTNNKKDTSSRQTEHGGYAHTLDSKMKISKANKGNTPWNKGKQRSAADRAKIGAGVRARNRAILLEKLKKIGMTEDEWYAKKKQLKYLRERVRKAKKAKDDKALAAHQKKLQSALDEQDKVNNQSSQLEMETKKPPKAKKKTAKPPAKAKEEFKLPPKTKIVVDPLKTKRNDASPTKTNTAEGKSNVKSKLQNDKPEVQKRRRSLVARHPVPTTAPGGVRLRDIFAKDVKFKPHNFEASDLENPYETCPNGGPGGLICCAACTKKYSDFLTSTAKDIEEQKTRKVNKEVIELLGFLNGAKAKLDDAIRGAKQRAKGGPLHRPQQSNGPPPVVDRLEKQLTLFEAENPPEDVGQTNSEMMQELPAGMFQGHEHDQKQQSPVQELHEQMEDSAVLVHMEDMGAAQQSESFPSVFQAMIDSTPIGLTLKSLPTMEDEDGTSHPAEEEKHTIEFVAV